VAVTLTKLPRAILIDMDDTILSAYGKPDVAWRVVVEEFAAEFGPLAPEQVAAAIAASARTFWQNAEPHWRLKLDEARHEVVRNGFSALAASGGAALSNEFAVRLADRFSIYRDEQMFLFPGVHEALQTFKASGVKLALITNGAGAPQRRKIERFALAERFDHVQIEGEHGFGKPDERAYHHAMGVLGVSASDTWMVGDNLEWEVEVPQRLGIYAIWMDAHGEGLPADSNVRPDRIVRSLTELLQDREP
jgi:putative hydrolase of the HAD superfamily